MAKKQKTIEELILEGFEGNRIVSSFKHFTDEEFIGYVAGVTKLQNLSHNSSVLEILNETRRLFKEGQL